VLTTVHAPRHARPDRPAGGISPARSSTPLARAAHAARVALAAGAALAGSAAAIACRSTPAAFGPTGAAASARADDLLTGLGNRFTRIDRDAKYTHAIEQLARGALMPSRVYDDTAVWTGSTRDGTRILASRGHFEGDHYVVAAMPDPPAPAALADTRDSIRLTRIARGEFTWHTSDVQALGALDPDDIANVLASMLAAAATSSTEGTRGTGRDGAGDGATLKAGSLASFPRSAAILGQLFSLDTVHTAQAPNATTAVTLVFGVHPDRLRAAHPAYAAFLQRYTGATHLRCDLTDAEGAEWFAASFGNGQLAMRFRATGDGHLAPGSGPPRPMPDSLVLHGDLETRMWVFTLGFSGLASDFVIERGPRARAWRFAFRHEPQWHFPLAIDHLVKSSLHRPFDGSGSQLRLALRGTPDGHTWLVRDLELTVQESAVVRWLGGLGGNAMADFGAHAEADENAFLASVFLALRDDIRADLRGRARAGEIGQQREQ